MLNFWIIVLCLGLLEIRPINGQSDTIKADLIVPKYVERGASATLQCRHNVRPEILFKVTWLKVDYGKFFEFINGRNPPFRNSTIDGGEIDWENSNQTQVTLKNVNFNLSGHFFCEVSTDTPIFTKASADELMTVFLPQTGPPIIKFRKRAPFYVGERLMALCNTTRARPAPHVVWLINGKKVDEKFVRTTHVYSPNGKANRHKQNPLQNLPEAYIRQPFQPQYQQQFQQPQYNQQYQNAHDYLLALHYDRYDKSQLRWGGRPWDEFSSYDNFQNPVTSIQNNPFSSLAHIHGMHEPTHHKYEKKHMEMKKKHLEMKKQRNSGTHKSRRHLNENALGIIRSTLNSGGFGPQPPTMNNELGMPGTGAMNHLAATYQRPLAHPSGNAVHVVHDAITSQQQEKGMYSISQLNIELTEEYIGINGRMELTCLSTIPSTISQGEQYADYKTYSVKIEVVKHQTLTTTMAPTNIGMAALGNGQGATDSNSLSSGKKHLLAKQWKLMWICILVLPSIINRHSQI